MWVLHWLFVFGLVFGWFLWVWLLEFIYSVLVVTLCFVVGCYTGYFACFVVCLVCVFVLACCYLRYWFVGGLFCLWWTFRAGGLLVACCLFCFVFDLPLFWLIADWMGLLLCAYVWFDFVWLCLWLCYFVSGVWRCFV